MNNQPSVNRSADPLIPDPQATLEQAGSQAVLYDRRSGKAHVLNASAARLWELCDGESTIDEVVARFAAGYDLPGEAVRPDVEKLVASFRELGVLS